VSRRHCGSVVVKVFDGISAAHGVPTLRSLSAAVCKASTTPPIRAAAHEGGGGEANVRVWVRPAHNRQHPRTQNHSLNWPQGSCCRRGHAAARELRRRAAGHRFVLSAISSLDEPLFETRRRFSPCPCNQAAQLQVAGRDTGTVRLERIAFCPLGFALPPLRPLSKGGLSYRRT